MGKYRREVRQKKKHDTIVTTTLPSNLFAICGVTTRCMLRLALSLGICLSDAEL